MGGSPTMRAISIQAVAEELLPFRANTFYGKGFWRKASDDPSQLMFRFIT
jgi:hypothetical protein